MQLENYSAVQLSGMIAAGDSSRQVATYFLDRLQRLDPVVSAMVNVVDEDLILERARQVDVKITQGEVFESVGWITDYDQGCALYARIADDLFVEDARELQAAI